MIVKVNGPRRIPPFRSTRCDEDFKVPEKFHNSFTDTDLILFVYYKPSYRGYFASAGYCNINTYNNRPDMGFIALRNIIDYFTNTNL